MLGREDAKAQRREPSERVNRLAHELVGAAIEVHRTLGPGYLESAYEEALAIELGLRGLAFERERPFAVIYKDHPVGSGRLDLLVEKELLVEIKAVDGFHPVWIAQVISYLKATNLTLGILLNFNTPVMKEGVRRVVYSDASPP